MPRGDMDQRPVGRHAGTPAPTAAGPWRPQVSEDATPRTDAPTKIMRALRDAEGPAGSRDGFTRTLPAVDPAAPVLPRGTTHSSQVEITQLLPASQTAKLPLPELEGSRRRVREFPWRRPERGLRNPAMLLAVELFRRAQWLSRERNRRLDVMERQLDSWDGQIEAFAQRWRHVDAHWDKVRARLDDSNAGRAAASLEAAYAEGGTELCVGMVTELAHLLAAGSLEKGRVAR